MSERIYRFDYKEDHEYIVWSRVIAAETVKGDRLSDPELQRAIRNIEPVLETK